MGGVTLHTLHSLYLAIILSITETLPMNMEFSQDYVLFHKLI